jgi:Cu(I)/Ag(I) efflux system membrane fusion protein
MHPQIRMPDPGQCPICAMDLIPASNTSGEDKPYEGLHLSDHAKKRAHIATAALERKPASHTVHMTGKVTTDESRRATITSRVNGRIDTLFVTYTGERVARGDPLARIYSPELISLQKELLEAARTRDRLGRDSTSVSALAARRTFNAAKEKLRLLGFSTRQLTSILERGTATDHMTLYAHHRGIVLDKRIEEGVYVQKGTPLLDIADLSTVWIHLDAYESDLSWLSTGQEVEVQIASLPGHTVTGRITFISPVVSEKTRTVDVRITVPNPQHRLKPGMFVKARVAADLPAAYAGARAPLLIPATAVLHTGRRAVAYVEKRHDAEPAYEGREIVLGPRAGKYYVVASGLAEGERVVVQGAFYIDAELQIRAKPSMMHPEGLSDTRKEPSTFHRTHDTTHPATPQPDSIEIPPSLGRHLKDLYAGYFSLSRALADDAAKDAIDALYELAATCTSYTGSSHHAYDTWNAVCRAIRTTIPASSRITHIDTIRGLFENISTSMTTLVRHYGPAVDTPYYRAYCPMAFDNKGAYWLQTDQDIRNPYYGSRMRTCGSIQDTFASRDD